MSDEQKSSCCDSCEFETEELRYYSFDSIGRTSSRKGAWLCALCANTSAGTALQYPSQYQDRHAIATTCYVGNRILAGLAAEPSSAPGEPIRILRTETLVAKLDGLVGKKVGSQGISYLQIYRQAIDDVIELIREVDFEVVERSIR